MKLLKSILAALGVLAAMAGSALGLWVILETLGGWGAILIFSLALFGGLTAAFYNYFA